DSFNVKVDVVNSDNIHNTIFNSLVDSLNPNSRKQFSVDYNTISGTGGKSFYINIDPENKIPELYKDNNVFSIPFFVKSDTSHPTLDVTFDGINIMDGDYVSSNPKIKIELSDNSPLPITDTSAVSIYLDGNPVYYSQNQSAVSYSFNSSNPKYVITYIPVLKDGEYNIKIIGKNSVGTFADSAGYSKSFTVMGDPRLLNVYNYPNPFPKDTYFTFKLTQIPDELKIRIFTVAGRLVKEIEKHSSDLNYDFNKIYWDGRDQDGDMLANGVYFYKITLVKGDKKDNVIQKMAIVR
ncbi:MAG: FlgD immunoglobulin-like domain containing protein, partial [Ignavibacteriaceae bacterium]